jgi:hypothetical protein
VARLAAAALPPAWRAVEAVAYDAGGRELGHVTLPSRDGLPRPDRLEDQVEQLYQRIQLPHHWLTELQAALKAEIAARQGQAAQELQQLDRDLLGLEGERRKLLAAYYADAIDLGLLRQEQTRISQRTTTLEARRRSLTANLDDWRTILETAGRFATNCAAAYRHADPPLVPGLTWVAPRAGSSAAGHRPVERDGTGLVA